MAQSPKRICWDACAWIALIQKEKIQKKGGSVEDRFALCKSVIEAGEKGKIEIAISGLCLVEVCKNETIAASPSDKIAAYFEQEFILVVPVDTAVGTLGRKLMMGGHKLKPPDATHIATALFANADEMHTFDDKLLALSGKFTKADGTALVICKPAHGGPTLPLLKAVDEAKEEN